MRFCCEIEYNVFLYFLLCILCACFGILGMFQHTLFLNKNPDFVHTTNHGIL